MPVADYWCIGDDYINGNSKNKVPSRILSLLKSN